MPARKEFLEVAGREVAVSNPDKIFFPELGLTKIELVRYYLAVADGALRGIVGRPMALKRFVNGADGEFFFQKRAPSARPDWIETVELKFPSGRTAHEIVVRDAAQLTWIVNLGCIDLNPHPVRADDLDHPDEFRVDLDPVPGVGWAQILEVALATREVLEEFGLTAWPKTSGSRGVHVYARIERRWTFPEARRAAVALAREVERREPHLATSKWWKEERHGVFLDYNQNAKDRTVASAYSVRPTPDGRVSTPLTWDEVLGCRPEAFTIRTVPERFERDGDPWAGIDDAAGPALEEAGRTADARGDRASACAGKDRRSHRTAAHVDAADRDRAGRDREGSARRARAMEGEASRRRSAPGAGRRHGGLDARPEHDVDADPREPPPRAGGRAAGSGSARGRLRPMGRGRVARRHIRVHCIGPPLVEPPKTGRTREDLATLPFPVP
jgi:DNA ligase D-like protein (predicted polymerase)